MTEQLALDVGHGDVHACDFIVRGERLRCLHCGAHKPLPSWSIDRAPDHDWIEVSVTERTGDQLVFYKCGRCGLGATQREVRPHFTDERGT